MSRKQLKLHSFFSQGEVSTSVVTNGQRLDLVEAIDSTEPTELESTEPTELESTEPTESENTESTELESTEPTESENPLYNA